MFFSTPIALGGLGLDPPVIGTIMSIYGILNGVFIVCFFARLTDYFGAKRVYLMGITASVPSFALFPVINHLARNTIEGGDGSGAVVWAAVGLQVVSAVLFTSCYGTSRFKGVGLSMDLFPSLVRFRCGVHLHRGRCTQQILPGSHKRTRATVGVYRAFGRTRRSEFAVFAVDR